MALPLYFKCHANLYFDLHTLCSKRGSMNCGNLNARVVNLRAVGPVRSRGGYRWCRRYVDEGVSSP